MQIDITFGMYLGIIVFMVGAILGSFLNVLIYRMHTGRSLNGRSHCMSCGATLRWYELFPLLSYLMLRARCGHCSAWIPVRYWIVELLTGATFVGLFVFLEGSYLLFGLYALLALVLIVIAVYDMRHTIIPNECTFALIALALVFLSVRGFSGEAIVPDVLAGLGAGAFFYGLWYVSKGRWIGLGDAKIALPLGVIAGVSGAFSMVVLAFWVGAAVSVSLVLLRILIEKGTTALRFPVPHLTMGSEVPFAPFLIVGFVLAHLLHVHVFTITTHIMSLFG